MICLRGALPLLSLLLWVRSFPDYKFKVSDFEIAEIIDHPVAALLLMDAGERTRRTRQRQAVVPYTYAYENHQIVGATARILKQFLDIFTRVAAQL
jgi:hypothetical protein